jgi:hydroxypyruvate isomerase
MPRLAANLTYLFTEAALLDRFEAAAKAGFRGVEYQYPYAHDAQAMAEQLREHDLEMVLINLPPGDWQSPAIRNAGRSFGTGSRRASIVPGPSVVGS